MLAVGLPSASRIVRVPAVAVYGTVRPSMLALWRVDIVRSSTGAPCHTLAAAFARSSLCRSSTLFPLSLSAPPGDDCAKAGETARTAAAQKSESRRIGRILFGWMCVGRDRLTFAKKSFDGQPSSSTNGRSPSASGGTGSGQREQFVPLRNGFGEIRAFGVHHG